MNAYAINTLQEVMLYRGDELNPDEYGYLYEVVIAESRGDARAIFTGVYDLDFTAPLSIHLLFKNIDRASGVVWCDESDSVPLLIQASVLWYAMSDIEEWAQWQSWHDHYDVLQEVYS